MFERNIVAILQERLREQRNFIQILKGPRQTGKTTALKQLISKISIPTCFKMASIDFSSRDWLRAQWIEARNLALEHGEALLIIDEVQLINQWSSVVKELWDDDSFNDVNLKVILSGSSSLLLEEGLKESLAGRFETVYCGHWTYSECREAFGYTLDDYFYFGGYPKSAVIKNNQERWLDYIKNSIISPSISKDVISLEQIRKPALMEKLFTLAASFSSQELSFRKILGQLDDAGNTTTIAHYINLLDKASMLCGLQKFSNKTLKTRASSPKFVTYDNSLLVACFGQYRDFLLTDPQLRGRLVESSVGAFLLNSAKIKNFDVFWWRDGVSEVDYIIQKGERVIAIEVKSGRVKSTKGMSDFKNKFPASKSLIIGSPNCPLEKFMLGEIDLF